MDFRQLVRQLEGLFGTRVHMWYINPITRYWVQIRVFDDLKSCVEMEGTDWQWGYEGGSLEHAQ